MKPEIFIGLHEHSQIKIRKMEGFRTTETKDKKKLDIILDEVCRYYELDVDKVKSKTRIRKYSDGRQITALISRELTNFYLQDIGTFLGGRDHATMIHSINRISDRLCVEKKLVKDIEVITERIKNRLNELI